MSVKQFDNPKDEIAYFKQMLSSDPNWAERAIVVLYQYQTTDEKESGETHELNNVGFSGADSYILSSFAEQINNGWHLSEKQLKIAFKKMPKYSKQLYNISTHNKKN